MTDAIRSVYWIGGGSGAGKSTVATAVARRLDLRLYAVDGSVDEVARRIAALPGLRRAANGPERRRIWTAENAVAVRQIMAWWQDAIGRDRLPDGPVFPFSCECETLGCPRAVELAVTEYRRRAADGPVTAHA